MSKDVPVSEKVRQVIASASDKLTKKEIVDRLADLPLQTVTKCLSDQIRSGFVATEVDHLGVPRYYLTDIKPKIAHGQSSKKPRAERKRTGPKGDSSSKRRAEARMARKEAAAAEKPKPLQISDIDKVKQELGVKELHIQYETGYSRGYNDAMFHGHREAYNAGRQSVLKGLLKLLNIKGEVML